MTTTNSRAVVPIDTAGSAVSITLGGRTTVEVAIRGDAQASYRVDGRESKDADWVEGPATFSGSASYDDTFMTGWEQLRVIVTSGTGGSGDEAQIILCAGGK